MKINKRNPEATRLKIIEAASKRVLAQGFTATTIDQICADAGVTKGCFFHHFPNKDALGKATIRWWSDYGTALYAAAWQDSTKDPLDQLRAMMAIMEGFASYSDEPCVCVIGMIAQELSGNNPDLRNACGTELELWTENVERMLTDAKTKHPVRVDFSPREVAWFLNSLWQGSMLVAKTVQAQPMIVANLKMARSYVESLFVLSENAFKTS